MDKPEAKQVTVKGDLEFVDGDAFFRLRIEQEGTSVSEALQKVIDDLDDSRAPIKYALDQFNGQ